MKYQNPLSSLHYRNLCEFYDFSIYTSVDRKKLTEIREEKADLVKKYMRRYTCPPCKIINGVPTLPKGWEEKRKKLNDQYNDRMIELNKQEKELVLKLQELFEELKKYQAYLYPLSENSKMVLDIKHDIDNMNYIYACTRFYNDEEHDAFVRKIYALEQDLEIQVENL